VLYLILLIMQYEADLRPFGPLTRKVDSIVALYGGRDSPSSFVIVAAALTGVVKTKLTLHAMHPALQGNLAISGTSPGLNEDIATVVPALARHVAAMLKGATDFTFAALAQPAVDELAQAVQLAWSLGVQPPGASAVLDGAKTVPLLASAVTFPRGNAAPLPRFA
jgi:hypothetical protein